MYLYFTVSAQTFKTRVIDDCLAPKWNEFFEAIVDHADGQKLRIEVIETTFDYKEKLKSI